VSTSLHTRLTPTEPDEWHQRVFPIDAQDISGGGDGTAKPPGLECLLLQASPEAIRTEQTGSLSRSAALASRELSLILGGRGPKTNVSQEFIVGNMDSLGDHPGGYEGLCNQDLEPGPGPVSPEKEDIAHAPVSGCELQ
jgi:hypothetical protein